MSEGSYIDLDNLTQENKDKMKNAAEAIVSYLEDNRSNNEAIKDVLDHLVDKLEADKDSAKKIKKTVRQAASAIFKDNAQEVRDDNTAVERFLESIGRL